METTLYIKFIEGKGRGVFSNIDINKGDVIEFCPVLIIPPSEEKTMKESVLYDYYFLWGEDQKTMALALGFGSLYNHDYSPNAVYETFFEDQILKIVAVRNIKAHEEITISYNQDPDNKKTVWFES
jgi:SET domain-containing protein